MIKSRRVVLLVLNFFVGVATAANILLIFWNPDILPFASFVAVRTLVFALITKNYWLAPVSLLCCGLIFIAAISIRRQYILFPSLFAAYLIYEISVLYPLWHDRRNEMNYDFKWYYIIEIIKDSVLVILLCLFCLKCLKDRGRFA